MKPPIIGPTILRTLSIAELIVIAFGKSVLGRRLGNIEDFDTLPNESTKARTPAKVISNQGEANPTETEIVKTTITTAISALLQARITLLSIRSVMTPAICVPNRIGKKPTSPKIPRRYFDPVI